MEGEQQGRAKKGGTRRRTSEGGQWDGELTLQLDEFYRHFTYYYPNKNKEEIISKCQTPNVFWITLDSLFYPQSVETEAEKIILFRRKSILKNGAYPPTKDALEEQKFILTLRKVVSFRQDTLDIDIIRNTTINQVLTYLGDWLTNHEQDVSRRLQQRYLALDRENEQLELQLQRLAIPIVRASRLFAYEHLEREVINSSIEKATLKEKEPRCDFCFTREKDILKCNSCAFHTHPACFARLPKDPIPTSFTCDNCIRAIPPDAHCELCPSKGGHFLELSDDAPAKNYRLIRGETILRFRINIETQDTRERRFLHVSCFVLHSECTYNAGIGLVEGLHLVDRNRKNMVNCSICGNMLGMTVPCNNENCRRSFHPECAKRHNLTISVIKANNKALLEIYCERHKKPESYEYLKDSASNRIREIRKFYENVDYELKRGPHPTAKNKRVLKYEELIRQDKCLICTEENDFLAPITNCLKCYGWHHDHCSKVCANCDIV